MRKILFILLGLGIYTQTLAQPFYSGFSTYTSDGLFNANALPTRFITPGNAETRIGYEDYGWGQYVPRIGLLQNSTYLTAANNSFGNIKNGSFTINVGANNEERIRVLPSGYVGIGVTEPSVPLQVNGIIRWGGLSQNYFYSGQDAVGGYIGQVGSTSAASRIRIQTSKTADFGNYSQFYLDPDLGFSFYTTGSANGNVGIGTTSPQYPLDISKVINGNYVARIINTSGATSQDGGLIVETSTASGAKVLSLRTNGVENFSLDGTATAFFKGAVGIGTTQPDAKLTVKGKIHAEEVKVDLSVPGPDYVFEKEYNLKSLMEVEKYVSENKHLPEIPSAKVMKEEGVSMGEMQMKLLQKIEELTLYIIELNKKQEQQETEIRRLKNK